MSGMTNIETFHSCNLIAAHILSQKSSTILITR